MIEIGKKNILRVEKFTEHGAYLTDGNQRILLPKKYLWGSLRLGEELEVFVYNDSEDRPVATTTLPIAQVGEVAFLEVVETNRFGSFLDWGLEKDILVPFSEQKQKMKIGHRYPVYIFLDDASKRVVASAKIAKFIGNVFPSLNCGDEVEIIPFEKTELGWRVVVDNLYPGMIYDNEIYRPVHIGEKMHAVVKNIREDGRIDLILGDKSEKRITRLAADIFRYYKQNNDTLKINDSSSPDEIAKTFSCSKKDFKKALGQLLKERKIQIEQVRGTTVKN